MNDTATTLAELGITLDEDEEIDEDTLTELSDGRGEASDDDDIVEEGDDE